MIDIHSHIIPSIDDGAKSEEIALEMLSLAECTGTRKIILTPHYFRGKFMTPLSEVKEKLSYMKKLAEDNNINLELYVGQEIYFTPSLLEDLKNGEIGTLNDTRYMLIEFNLAEIDEEALDILYELRIKGIIPVIAHPERYLELQKEPSKINDFIEEGCLFQLNAASISGLFGKEAKKIAKIFLEHNIYNFIGSDAHTNNKRDTNLKKYKESIEEIQKGFMKVASENAQLLLDNQEVRFKGRKIEKKKKKGFFSFFKK